MKWPQHGSNPQYLYQFMGIPMPEQVLDFSANINPLGPPDMLRQKWSGFFHQISDYPDPQSMSLKTAIAKKEGLNPESILIGNGGAELITLIGRMLTGKNVLIIEPAFSEYEKACRTNGCHVFYHLLEEPRWKLNLKELAERLSSVDAIFLCNPTNPTGVSHSYSEVLELLQDCKTQDTLLIVDEAFYDFLEDYEPIVPLLKEFSNLLVIRSMTKMFAIPGLRLGYVLAAEEIIAKLESCQPHWSVNTLALLAGEVCIQEEQYIKKTTKYTRREREKLFTYFHNEGYAFSPSQINFYLLRDTTRDDQYPFFQFLLQKGIVPRHTVNFPGLEGRWLRFAIKGEKDNDRLMEVLSEWKHHP